MDPKKLASWGPLGYTRWAPRSPPCRQPPRLGVHSHQWGHQCQHAVLPHPTWVMLPMTAAHDHRTKDWMKQIQDVAYDIKDYVDDSGHRIRGLPSNMYCYFVVNSANEMITSCGGLAGTSPPRSPTSRCGCNKSGAMPQVRCRQPQEHQRQ